MTKKGLPTEKLELTIPARAAKATKIAYKSAINSGHYVLIASRGKLVKIHPNMRREPIGDIPKPSRVTKGSKIKIN